MAGIEIEAGLVSGCFDGAAGTALGAAAFWSANAGLLVSGVTSAVCLPATTEASTVEPLLATSGTVACTGAVPTLSLTREAALDLAPEEEVVVLTGGAVAASHTMIVHQCPTLNAPDTRLRWLKKKQVCQIRICC